VNRIINTNSCVRKKNLGRLKGYLDSLVKATLLGKIKDAACINIGEQLFQRSTAKIFMAYDCGTWTFYKHMFNHQMTLAVITDGLTLSRQNIRESHSTVTDS